MFTQKYTHTKMSKLDVYSYSTVLSKCVLFSGNIYLYQTSLEFLQSYMNETKNLVVHNPKVRV